MKKSAITALTDEYKLNCPLGYPEQNPKIPPRKNGRYVIKGSI